MGAILVLLFTMPLQIDEHGGIRVSLRVNGAGPFTFVIDTGAARTIVSDELARELGAPVVARSEVMTSAGSEMGMVVRLSSVALAASRVEGLLAPVVPAGRLASLGRGVRGLLGQDFLSAFNYTLDYRRARLTWDARIACDAPGAVRLAPAEGRFVLSAADGRGQQLRLVPDTGAEVVVLFHAENQVGMQQVALTGIAGGSRRASLITLPRLHIGSATLRQVTAVIAERDDAGADGLLPLHAFSSVTFAAGGECLVARD